jgi:hypothetical protein
MKFSAILLTLAVAVLATQTSTSPQQRQAADLSQVLVGRWEGEVNIPRDITPSGRVLEVKSALHREGAWTVEALYGVLGRGGLSPVSATIDLSGGETILSFTTGANSAVRLTLSGSRTLAGTLTTSGSGTPYRMRFEKVK